MRDINEWAKEFRDNEYIEYVCNNDKNGQELRILDKPLYIQEIINFFAKTYFKRRLAKLHKSKQLRNTEVDILGMGKSGSLNLDSVFKKGIDPSIE